MKIILWLLFTMTFIYMAIYFMKIAIKNYKTTTPLYNIDSIAILRCKFFQGILPFETNLLCQFDAKQNELQITSLGYANRVISFPYDKIVSFEHMQKLSNTFPIQSTIEYISLKSIKDNEISELIFFIDELLIKLYNQKASKKCDIYIYVNMRIQKNESNNYNIML